MGRALVAVGRKFPPHPTYFVTYYHRPEWEPQREPDDEEEVDMDILYKIEQESGDFDG